jgi:hypothetical protein
METLGQLAVIGLDLVAIGVLAFAVYFPRHRRADLAVAFVGINVGVLAVSMVLGSTTIGAGLGLGLFGVLSIIRLRSREIEQSEIAYYFAALAIGLICGLAGGLTWLHGALIALVVAALAIVDSPHILRRWRQQTIVVDRAIADDEALRAHVEGMLGCGTSKITVRSLDFVSDTTTVDVRYAIGTAPTRAAIHPDHEVAR